MNGKITDLTGRKIRRINGAGIRSAETADAYRAAKLKMALAATRAMAPVGAELMLTKSITEAYLEV